MPLVADINFNMKILNAFILLSMSLTFVACNENIAAGDKLTAAERQFLRDRAAAKCIAASDSSYRELETASNNNMLAFERNQTWKYEYKKDSTIIETSYLYVWKVSPPHVYFRLSITEGVTTTNKFIKLDTSSNIDMFRAFQQKGCAKTLTVTGSSSRNANIEVARSRVDTETLTESETDYRIVSTYPAYFANLNKLLTKRTLNNSEAVTKTEKYDYTISTNAAAVQPLLYTDATITNKTYCVVKFTAPLPSSSYDTYAFPFDEACTATPDANNPDANADSVADFDPATELVGPF